MTKILLDRHENMSVLTINRPKAANSLDPETVCLLADAFVELKNDAKTKVVVVTGTGNDAFCAGGDLSRFLPLITASREPEDSWDHRVLATPDILNTALLRGFDIDKPVIAAINGYAVAGGMELVQGTDLRVASTTAKFGVQEVKWALFPAGGSTVRLPRQLTMPRAMELLLTGDLINANTALEWGFINRVVQPQDVLDTAMELAGRIAALSAVAVRQIRRSARACAGLPESAALAMEKEFAATVFASEDAREGPRSFMEKRPAVFNDR